jgi:CRP-like cAMP-binding protein
VRCYWTSSGPTSLFGESAFLEGTRHTERAEAIENTEVMSWTVSNIEDRLRNGHDLQCVASGPRATQRRVYAPDRELCARQRCPATRPFTPLAQRLGTRQEGGSVSMIPLTHQMLSRYVCTSLEIVTHHMNEFRNHGYVTYSRRGISLRRDTLQIVLD